MNAVEAFSETQDLLHRFLCDLNTKDYANSTPCSEWNVQALLNHIVSELKWMPQLMHGKTIAEVGDKFEGDLIGEEPHKVWEQASDEVIEALDGADLAKAVHLSYGDKSGEYYLNEMTIDQAIHCWDLAVALVEDYEIPEHVAQHCYELLKPVAEEWRQAGSLGPSVEEKVDMNWSEKLLALSGRNPAWRVSN